MNILFNIVCLYFAYSVKQQQQQQQEQIQLHSPDVASKRAGDPAPGLTLSASLSFMNGPRDERYVNDLLPTFQRVSISGEDNSGVRLSLFVVEIQK